MNSLSAFSVEETLSVQKMMHPVQHDDADSADIMDHVVANPQDSRPQPGESSRRWI
jgi:hypothetical protein